MARAVKKYENGGEVKKIEPLILPRYSAHIGDDKKMVCPEGYVLKDGQCVLTETKQAEKDIVDYYTHYLNSPKHRERVENLKEGEYGEDLEFKTKEDVQNYIDARLEQLRTVKYKYIPEEEWNKVSEKMDENADNIWFVMNNMDIFDDVSSRYKRKKHQVRVSPGQAKEHNTWTTASILANEIEHAIGATSPNWEDYERVTFINHKGEQDWYMKLKEGRARESDMRDSEKGMIYGAFKKGYLDDENIGDHDKKPTEIKSDIGMTRWELYNQGIYDAGTEDFTQEHLNYIKANPEKFGKWSVLKKAFEDEDLIKLMNELTKGEITDDMPRPEGDVTTARRGARIVKRN